MTDTLPTTGTSPTVPPPVAATTVAPWKPALWERLLAPLAAFVERHLGWQRVRPRFLGVVVLIGLRVRLRQHNLVDTGVTAPRHGPPEGYQSQRTDDGTYNDLLCPGMGARGARFGRNVPLGETRPETDPQLMSPSPHTISRQLLTRDPTREPAVAAGANLLVAGWLQFEVHDWFSHGPSTSSMLTIPSDPQYPWPHGVLQVGRTRPDPHPVPGVPATSISEETHWWDGSQLYGSSHAAVTRTRAGAPLGLLPTTSNLPLAAPVTEASLAGIAGNAWLGLDLMHTLFTLEHNQIAAHLHDTYPDLDDDELFRCARLVNVALMAKIHTLEWTPAVIGHPTTKLAMRVQWWGVLGERLGRRWGRGRGLFKTSDAMRGIPGTPTDHFGVPFSLTEEFVAVYRMHPLLPDAVPFFAADGGAALPGEDAERTLTGLQFPHSRELLERVGAANAFYSFGRAHPGRIQLFNYPSALQDLHRPTGEYLDLAAVDILRNRERGVPRYNDFRRLFHMRPAATFDDVTSNSAWAAKLREVYDDEIEALDLMIGCYAEDLPEGFVFSDTAFRVFLLMASRRLNSDRFFTSGYTAENYTAAGLRWVDENSLATVLVRNFPVLEPALRGVENAFETWNDVS